MSGSQFLVKEGDVVTVPHLGSAPGATVPLDVLLLRSDEKLVVGSPTVPGAKVEVEVLAHVRASKVTIHKFIRRENYRRKKGHRQPLTRVKVARITPGAEPGREDLATQEHQPV
ncbi:50S ribosomal protein L21 [candidate division WOR-3 bacterium]|nr:50S ribosomal protein L21 [candidate division WOR-3 bacterium]